MTSKFDGVKVVVHGGAQYAFGDDSDEWRRRLDESREHYDVLARRRRTVPTGHMRTQRAYEPRVERAGEAGQIG